jgi:hypothetical protein
MPSRIIRNGSNSRAWFLIASQCAKDPDSGQRSAEGDLLDRPGGSEISYEFLSSLTRQLVTQASQISDSKLVGQVTSQPSKATNSRSS